MIRLEGEYTTGDMMDMNTAGLLAEHVEYPAPNMYRVTKCVLAYKIRRGLQEYRDFKDRASMAWKVLTNQI